MAAEFTHLHLHTDYSLLDGACDVDKLAKHLQKIGQTSAAMTDHGNIYGAVHFFDAMKKNINLNLSISALSICLICGTLYAFLKPSQSDDSLKIVNVHNRGYRLETGDL